MTKAKRWGPEKTPNFKQFSLVVSAGKPFARENTGNTIFVILSKKLKIPFFDTATGSVGDKIPMNFENPNEWNGEWHGYIMYNTLTGETVLHDATEFQQYVPSPHMGNSDACLLPNEKTIRISKNQMNKASPILKEKIYDSGHEWEFKTSNSS